MVRILPLKTESHRGWRYENRLVSANIFQDGKIYQQHGEWRLPDRIRRRMFSCMAFTSKGRHCTGGGSMKIVGRVAWYILRSVSVEEDNHVGWVTSGGRIFFDHNIWGSDDISVGVEI